MVMAAPPPIHNRHRRRQEDPPLSKELKLPPQVVSMVEATRLARTRGAMDKEVRAYRQWLNTEVRIDLATASDLAKTRLLLPLLRGAALADANDVLDELGEAWPEYVSRVARYPRLPVKASPPAGRKKGQLKKGEHDVFAIAQKLAIGMATDDVLELYELKPKDLRKAMAEGVALGLCSYHDIARSYALSHGEALLPMVDTNPAVLVMAAVRPDVQMKDPENIVHPGQLVSYVKDWLMRGGMRASSWRTASRLDPAVAGILSANAKDSLIVAVAMNAMAKFQIREPGQDQILLACNLVHTVFGYRRDKPSSLALDEAEKTAAFAMRHMQKNPITGDEVQEVADFVSSAIRRKERTTATSWNGLRRESDEWHRETVHREMEAIIQQEMKKHGGKVSAWNSLVEPLSFDDQKGTPVVIQPLTNVVALHAEGVLMKHCVGSYGRQCLSGRSRIFAIRNAAGLAATMELQLDGKKWKVVQVRGPRNHHVDGDVQELAKMVAEAYQDEWSATDEKERHKELLVTPQAARSKG